MRAKQQAHNTHTEAKAKKKHDIETNNKSQNDTRFAFASLKSLPSIDGCCFANSNNNHTNSNGQQWALIFETVDVEMTSHF